MDFTTFIKNPPQEIVKYPDPILRRECKQVEQFDDDLRCVVSIMFKSMYKWNGVGLAAPQVGLPYRLFVVNKSATPYTEQVFINPEKIHLGIRTYKDEEGCLSIPGVRVSVERPHKFLFRAQDMVGKMHKYAYEGLMGRIILHEFQHLSGILIIDNMSPADKERVAPILANLCEQSRNKITNFHRN